MTFPVDIKTMQALIDIGTALWASRLPLAPLRATHTARRPTLTLDEAWREAEIALRSKGEGWGDLTLIERNIDRRSRYLATARQHRPDDEILDYTFGVHGYGRTPVEALRALIDAVKPKPQPCACPEVGHYIDCPYVDTIPVMGHRTGPITWQEPS